VVLLQSYGAKSSTIYNHLQDLKRWWEYIDCHQRRRLKRK